MYKNSRHFAALTLAFSIAFVSAAIPQSNPTPNTGDRGILINPTITECARGWANDVEVKWSKEQFEQLCATVNSPAAIVANPTVDECNKGWEGNMRWTKAQFENFCEIQLKSK